MSLTQQQVTLVQSTFAQIAPASEAVAVIFYARLFELDPSLGRMFKTDIYTQSQKLMQMLSVAVHALDRLDEIVPAVQALGRRHVDYGVLPEHYATVGEALMWTLAKGLGPRFTPEVMAAWAAVYDLLATTALEAAYQPAA